MKMLQPAKQALKRPTPEGEAAPEVVTPQNDATFCPLPRGPALQDLPINPQRSEAAAPASPPNLLRARTSEPAGAAAIGPLGAVPVSPGRNRQLFLAQMTPQHMTCDLTSAVVGLGVKHNLQAIVVACYPIQKGPPSRRHVTLRDQHGATGLQPGITLCRTLPPPAAFQ
jgi:hypothetical protein